MDVTATFNDGTSLSQTTAVAYTVPLSRAAEAPSSSEDSHAVEGTASYFCSNELQAYLRS